MEKVELPAETIVKAEMATATTLWANMFDGDLKGIDWGRLDVGLIRLLSKNVVKCQKQIGNHYTEKTGAEDVRFVVVEI